MFKNLSNKEKIIIILFTPVCIIIPWIMDWSIFGNDVKSNLDNGQWSGFLGSYAGGIISGIATLLAVVISLNISRKVQTDSELRENSLIVYYDLVLGLNDLKKLYINSKNRNFVNIPSRMFFSNEWIKNVAKISEDIKNVKIDMIYKLYGDLEIVSKYVLEKSEADLYQLQEVYDYEKYIKIIDKVSRNVFNDNILSSNMEEFSSIDDVELDVDNELNSDYVKLIKELEYIKNKYKG